MDLTKEVFIEDFKNRLSEKYALDVKDASPLELYHTLSSIVTSGYSGTWRDTWKRYLDKPDKQAYYFSIEFLPGKMLKSNLLNMGWLDTVEAGFAELGLDLDEIAQVEPDMALGNGGLGRLASCFMDSIASSSLPGNGNGIRYKYGLFRQKFIDGYQVELPNEWLHTSNSWEIRRESKAVDVLFGGNVYLKEDDNGALKPVYENPRVVRAVPYDTGMVGYKNFTVNTMRLWDAEIPPAEDAKYLTIEARRKVEDLTSVLYPDDSNEDGRLLRLSQEYFFVSAGVQSVVRHYKKYGRPMSEISEYIAIHINDTHPAMCVAEFMRILMDEENLTWEKAWDLTVKVMSYTNHTILAEALEKWPRWMLKEVQPRILQIVEELDRRFVEEMSDVIDYETIQRTRIIKDEQIHMAHLAIIGSHSTNGVAKLHSDLLKNIVLHDFYRLYPERFNNKTNGIAQRRWSQLANPAMSSALDETIGDSWRFDSEDLRLLMNYTNDPIVLARFAKAKQKNKQRLAAFIKNKTGIEVTADAIFDVQIKRLHAYKRQLLNLMHIIKLYLDLKTNPDLDIQPRVFLFGAKAAPSYHYAKSIIKAINETANMINQDETIQGKLKVVFLENYSVTLAELIIPAADVSEQISLASKEASGTSNMKLMLNGALTIATLDGANIEIRDAVGDENIFIFGLTEEQVYSYYEDQSYHAWDYYHQDPVIRRVLDTFVNGFIPNIELEGREIFDSLTKYNDEFFVLRDFTDYIETQQQLDHAYRDQERWQKMSLVNIANAGRFSADDTVRRYAEEIWHLDPVYCPSVRKGDKDASYPL